MPWREALRGRTFDTRYTSLTAARDGLADELLHPAVSVHLGRVDVRQPELDAALERGHGGPSGGALELPRALPDDGNPGGRPAEGAQLHPEPSSAAIELPRGFGLHGRERCGTRRAA